MIKDGAGRSAAEVLQTSPTVARGAGPNGTGDGVMATGFLATMIATAKRPLLVKLHAPREIVRTVDAAVKVGNGTCDEFTRNTGLGNQLDFLTMPQSLECPCDSQ